MPEDGRRERDLILAPNEHAFILDETKGNIVNYVGPHKTSLANTDQPVTFNDHTKRFERCLLEKAIKLFAIAPEGWYVALKNPAQDGKPPTTGTANSLPLLDIGRKVTIPGPVAFAPWPGQMVRVIQGHHLHSNQFLIVRVYDEEAARENWTKAVIKPQTAIAEETPVPGSASEDVAAEAVEVKPDVEVSDLTMGKQLVIKGTDVSFYIPPTGIEVVPGYKEQFVRNAVTLERLEYCILLDEDGNKRFIKGPAVVFPKPTEAFIKKEGSRKFRAIELNEISGLYIKVIAPYKNDNKSYQVGDELFITGKDQMIYFPRPEHAIIRYGEREVHYAVAIPAGEARYVLNRLNGQIRLAKGPAMLLSDPRKEVIVRRVLDPRRVNIWFPGNQEALEYNRRLMAMTRQEKGEEFVSERQVKAAFAEQTVDMEEAIEEFDLELMEDIPEEFAGDEFKRQQQFSPPRTITLDTKYEGAVSINAWTGYAVLVISKIGERKVILGPQSYLLEYDELLETVELSTGTPKNEQKLLKTVYLRILHNKVSDIIEVETLDLCPVSIYVSYRVNFEGEPQKWFDVENYVKFLTEHTRSVLRNAIKRHGIEYFYANAIQVVRDTILRQADDAGKRPGMIFDENGMRIYDVEVLNVTIEDQKIAQLLMQAQHTNVQQTLELEAARRDLDVRQEKEEIRQKIAQAESESRQHLVGLEAEEIIKQLELNLTKIEAEAKAEQRRLDSKTVQQEALDTVHHAELARQKASSTLDLSIAEQRLVQQIQELKADVEAVVNKAGAVSPQLIAALQAFSDKALAERLARSMAPLAILGGTSVADVFGQLVKGTVLEKVLAETVEKVEKEG
ncbi:MAG: hypothetical protein GY801_12440 [bacterium]|nr:hypothetical protein [bacterium]